MARKTITNKLDFLNKSSTFLRAIKPSGKTLVKFNDVKKKFIIKKLVTLTGQRRKLLAVGVIFFTAIALMSALYWSYQKLYADKYYIGLKIAGVNLGGKTKTAAREILLHKIDEFGQKGLTVNYKEKKLNIAAAPISSAPDASVDLFSFNAEQTLTNLFKTGRSGNLIKNIKEQLLLLILPPEKPVDFYIDEKRLKALLYDHFHSLEKKAENAAIAVVNDEITMRPETLGKVFSYDDIIKQLKSQAAYLDGREIEISLKTDYPEVYAEDLAAIFPEAKKIIQNAAVKLTLPADLKDKVSGAKEWEIEKQTLAGLLAAKKNVFKYNIGWVWSVFNKKLYLGLKETETKKYLAEEIAPAVDLEPIDAKFTIAGDKVAEFVSSRPGRRLDIEENFKLLEEAVLKTADATATESFIIELIVKEAESKITNENVNNLGIKEIIGTGYSGFSGSPTNRRHNIGVGAKTLHGTLIKPGETFSLNITLGEITAQTNYLPELVIKENKTVPEYGGGLCQIGTTVFRAALDSGLPIVERRNHSYRVRYYEPAGTDATIYSPSPDFKFLNDTGNYILIQERTAGDNLYFDFWGTDDGRKVTRSEPEIYNIKAPPPTKIIITDELPPGEKKCTEHAVNGADARFNYKVEYPDGNIKEETFFSHYRPWQEVCLVGATSTPEIINDDE